MKKFLVVICSAILAFGLAGCGKGKAPVGKGKAPAPVVTTKG
jgi:ABC-type Zn uptake system ZnuABC Zn-binding protein ZnuA